MKKSVRVLLLAERVKTCKWWVTKLNSLGIPSGLLIGGQKFRKHMSDTIAGLKSGRILVGVGTKVADEGLDIPQLTHVFVTAPVHKHRKRLVQMLGRAARPGEGKKEAVCVYFWDSELFPFVRSELEREEVRKKFLKGLTSVVDSFDLDRQFVQ